MTVEHLTASAAPVLPVPTLLVPHSADVIRRSGDPTSALLSGLLEAGRSVSGVPEDPISSDNGLYATKRG